MAYRVIRSVQASRDLEALYEYLYASAFENGETADRAYHLASTRISEIDRAISRLAAVPFQGTRHDDLLDGLRHVTKGRAILYFIIDPAEELVRLLAVFYGGQDHQRRMLVRLTAGAGGGQTGT